MLKVSTANWTDFLKASSKKGHKHQTRLNRYDFTPGVNINNTGSLTLVYVNWKNNWLMENQILSSMQMLLLIWLIWSDNMDCVIISDIADCIIRHLWLCFNVGSISTNNNKYSLIVKVNSWVLQEQIILQVASKAYCSALMTFPS